jgi:hypothetical protein
MYELPVGEWFKPDMPEWFPAKTIDREALNI